MFPEHVTEQLLDGAKMVAESHECGAHPSFHSYLQLPFTQTASIYLCRCVTILFSDIVGFTSMSAEVSTAELFEMLNRYAPRRKASFVSWNRISFVLRFKC